MLFQIILLTTSLAVPGGGGVTKLDKLRGNSPIDFRCDAMQMRSKPNRVYCKGNVVVRRADLMVCCNTFEGYADAKGAWQRFKCNGTVRAQRRDELMWSEEATFILEQANLILTGAPELHRSGSTITGERVVVDTHYDHARVESPRGTMRTTPVESKNLTVVLRADVPLPDACPIPPRPAK